MKPLFVCLRHSINVLRLETYQFYKHSKFLETYQVYINSKVTIPENLPERHKIQEQSLQIILEKEKHVVRVIFV